MEASTPSILVNVSMHVQAPKHCLDLEEPGEWSVHVNCTDYYLHTKHDLAEFHCGDFSFGADYIAYCASVQHLATCQTWQDLNRCTHKYAGTTMIPALLSDSASAATLSWLKRCCSTACQAKCQKQHFLAVLDWLNMLHVVFKEGFSGIPPVISEESGSSQPTLATYASGQINMLWEVDHNVAGKECNSGSES